MSDLVSSVWMIHADTPSEGVRGTLAMDERGIVFKPKDEQPETIFPLEAIRRARRTLGSPVLQLRVDHPTQPRIVGFYFVRPPSLDPQQGRFGSRKKARRDAAVTLVTSNVGKKEEVAAWVGRIREAKKGR